VVGDALRAYDLSLHEASAATSSFIALNYNCIVTSNNKTTRLQKKKKKPHKIIFLENIEITQFHPAQRS